MKKTLFALAFACCVIFASGAYADDLADLAGSLDQNSVVSSVLIDTPSINEKTTQSLVSQTSSSLIDPPIFIDPTCLSCQPVGCGVVGCNVPHITEENIPLN